MAKVIAPVAVNFGDRAMYAGGAFIPDGDYCAFFNVMMHQGQDKAGVSKGPARLGVMVDFFPLLNPTEEAKIQQFYSMGSKADQSFAPNPVTGKGIVPIPGAKGSTLNDKTNWFMLLDSLEKSGLPQGVFTNDLTALDGVYIHVTNVDEPAERATFGDKLAEVQQERRINKIAIVTEIKDDGKPWEGTGGLTKAAAPKPAPTVEAEPATEDDEQVRAAAIDAISTVLGKNLNGMPRMALRTEVFKAVKKANSGDEAVASAVIEAFFENHETELAGVLGELGYAVRGVQVKPAA